MSFGYFGLTVSFISGFISGVGVLAYVLADILFSSKGGKRRG